MYRSRYFWDSFYQVFWESRVNHRTRMIDKRTLWAHDYKYWKIYRPSFWSVTRELWTSIPIYYESKTWRNGRKRSFLYTRKLVYPTICWGRIYQWNTLYSDYGNIVFSPHVSKCDSLSHVCWSDEYEFISPHIWIHRSLFTTLSFGRIISGKISQKKQWVK